jgi:serine/threonine protein kinase
MKNSRRSGRRIGTPHWMAPEIMRGEAYNDKADVYSFGMILWYHQSFICRELATGRIPYEGLSITQILGSVGYGDGQVEIPQVGNYTLLKLMQTCLYKETSKRPTFH